MKARIERKIENPGYFLKDVHEMMAIIEIDLWGILNGFTRYPSLGTGLKEKIDDKSGKNVNNRTTAAKKIV